MVLNYFTYMHIFMGLNKKLLSHNGELKLPIIGYLCNYVYSNDIT